jgi:S1 RNA binding domain protein
MAVEAGAILDGKVVKLLKFGVIVELPGGESGLIHISEIADQYVHEVGDFFRAEDTVKVKVIGRREEGRYELSAKQAEPRQPLPDAPQRAPGSSSGGGGGDREERPRASVSFEDRLADFLKESNRKQNELKRDRDGKRRGRK